MSEVRKQDRLQGKSECSLMSCNWLNIRDSRGEQKQARYINEPLFSSVQSRERLMGRHREIERQIEGQMKAEVEG